MVFFVIILDVRGYGSHDVIMRISWENDYCICDVLIEHSSPFFSLLLLQQGYLSIAESQRRGKKRMEDIVEDKKEVHHGNTVQ